jgi:hypothetical protein
VKRIWNAIGTRHFVKPSVPWITRATLSHPRSSFLPSLGTSMFWGQRGHEKCSGIQQDIALSSWVRTKNPFAKKQYMQCISRQTHNFNKMMRWNINSHPLFKNHSCSLIFHSFSFFQCNVIDLILRPTYITLHTQKSNSHSPHSLLSLHPFFMQRQWKSLPKSTKFTRHLNACKLVWHEWVDGRDVIIGNLYTRVNSLYIYILLK